MLTKKGKTSTEEFEKAAAKRDRAKYVFRLYVTGMTPKSARAIANVQKLCEEQLAGRYELNVIDIYQQPELAKESRLSPPQRSSRNSPATPEAHRRHIGQGKVSCRHRSETKSANP